jgi:hypothetical protein
MNPSPLLLFGGQTNKKGAGTREVMREWGESVSPKNESSEGGAIAYGASFSFFPPLPIAAQ